MRLHKLIQAAFGWENYHLFQFSPKGYASYPIIRIPQEDDDIFPARGEIFHAVKTKLSDIFMQPRQKFVYIYDFGDDWIHELTLEKINDEKLLRAACTDGKGACPPEDCGGPGGYANLKEIMTNPKHPEHKEMKGWLGMMGRKKWDAVAFNLEKTKLAVGKI
jgi:hypothetical protein